MTIYDIFDYVKGVVKEDYYGLIAVFKVLSAIFSIVFFVGTAYAVRKTQMVYAQYRKNSGLAAVSDILPTVAPSPKNIVKWNAIEAQAASDDENERKIAIIAADSLLDKIFVLQGYHGENLGARLRLVEPSDLETLQDLWEAHKLRNRIAHEANYILSRQDAQNAIQRYKKTLIELRYL